MDHARKSVQMHSLAKHFSEKITAKVKNDGNEAVFGKTFRYINISMKHIQVAIIPQSCKSCSPNPLARQLLNLMTKKKKMQKNNVLRFVFV